MRVNGGLWKSWTISFHKSQSAAQSRSRSTPPHVSDEFLIKCTIQDFFLRQINKSWFSLSNGTLLKSKHRISRNAVLKHFILLFHTISCRLYIFWTILHPYECSVRMYMGRVGRSASLDFSKSSQALPLEQIQLLALLLMSLLLSSSELFLLCVSCWTGMEFFSARTNPFACTGLSNSLCEIVSQLLPRTRPGVGEEHISLSSGFQFFGGLPLGRFNLRLTGYFLGLPLGLFSDCDLMGCILGRPGGLFSPDPVCRSW